MKLVQGSGSVEDGACWMSALAWYAGQEKWTDNAECVDPMIRHLCIAVNDRLYSDEDRERVIGPIIFAPMGTRETNLVIPRLERIVGFAMGRAGINTNRTSVWWAAGVLGAIVAGGSGYWLMNGGPAGSEPFERSIAVSAASSRPFMLPGITTSVTRCRGSNDEWE